MARVYLNAASFQAAKSPQKMTALFLNQTVTLPYFKVFADTYTPFARICEHIDAHLQNVLQQQGWQPEDLRQIPILLGSTAYAVSACEYDWIHHQQLPEKVSIAAIGSYLQQRYDAPVLSLATSCTSSAQAIHLAYKMIQNETYQQALIIGFEYFNRFTFEHFHAMDLLTKDDDYQPFIQSNGMILGEGIACIALSNQPNTNDGCELIGVASVTDNHHLTNASESSLIQLIQNIMKEANVSTAQIQAAKIHGIGGVFDEIEQRVLRQMLPESEWILPKPYFGHTLGASGALEMTWLFKQLQKGYLPPLPNQAAYHDIPLAHGKLLQEGYYLHYFLGFGGSNVGWVLDWQGEKRE